MQDFTLMTDANKQLAMQNVDALKTRGGTDIFNAIKRGINLVVDRKDKTRNP